MKSNKRLSSRIKVTRNGKLLTRKRGHAHLNAKTSSRKKIARRGTTGLTLSPKMRQLFITTLKK